MYVNILKRNSSDIFFLIVTGVLLLVAGFAMYYLLPQSLITMNLSQASYIFMLLMMFTSIAEIILSLTLMVRMHTFLADLFVFEANSIRMMLRKNLIAHQDRNRMSFGLFSLALGFMVYLS